MRTTLEDVKVRIDMAQDYVLEAIDLLTEDDDELSEILDEINSLILQVLAY